LFQIILQLTEVGNNPLEMKNLAFMGANVMKKIFVWLYGELL